MEGSSSQQPRARRSSRIIGLLAVSFPSPPSSMRAYMRPQPKSGNMVVLSGGRGWRRHEGICHNRRRRPSHCQEDARAMLRHVLTRWQEPIGEETRSCISSTKTSRPFPHGARLSLRARFSFACPAQPTLLVLIQKKHPQTSHSSRFFVKWYPRPATSNLRHAPTSQAQFGTPIHLYVALQHINKPEARRRIRY